jgi:hypothetical protein
MLVVLCGLALGVLENAPSFWPPHEAIYFYYNKESVRLPLLIARLLACLTHTTFVFVTRV